MPEAIDQESGQGKGSPTDPKKGLLQTLRDAHEVDHEIDFLELLERLLSQVAEAALTGFVAAGAQQVLPVVREREGGDGRRLPRLQELL